MHSIAQFSIDDLKAYIKCAQLYLIIQDKHFPISDSEIQLVKRLLQRDCGNVNFQIPLDSHLFNIYHSDCFIGGTLLHVAYSDRVRKNNEIFESLMNLGVDFTIKNEAGYTVLHNVHNDIYWTNDHFSNYQDNFYIQVLLSAHVKTANCSNPCNGNGLSHFHIACLANNFKAVEYFLENQVDVNDGINNEEDFNDPQYTPLHFAVKFYSMEVIEILLKYGADKNIKDGDGITPLWQLLKQRVELLGYKRHTKQESLERTIKEDANLNEKIMFMLLGKDFLGRVDIVDSTGLSSFHIACTMSDSSIAESLLEQVKDYDHCVNKDSSIYPGYTALHFAAHCNINTMNLLLRRGANIHMKDAKGTTPFDICSKRGIVQDIHSTLSLIPEWADTLFSDNKTRLVNFLSAMRDEAQLSNFLRNHIDDINMTLPTNFTLWPGCTPLHVAVFIHTEPPSHLHFPWTYGYEEPMLEQIEEILKCGADVTMRDANSKTPLHHAYCQDKIKVTSLLLKHHHSSANPMDEDNLSHLLIACAKGDEHLVAKILSSNNVDVNVPYKGKNTVQRIHPGCTPINLMIGDYGYGVIRRLLLQHGAVADPIKTNNWPVQIRFVSHADRYSTSELHFACYNGDKDAVERLLENGADMDLKFDDGCTPFCVALERNFPEILQLLLQRGANLFAKKCQDYSIFVWSLKYQFKNSINSIGLALKQSEELQKRMEKETGITMLHLACNMLDVEEVEKQLDRGTKVDVRVHEDSKIWRGCTALQLLIARLEESDRSDDEQACDKVNAITKLLVKNGADVTLADSQNDTPIHLSYTIRDKNYVSRTESLFKNHRDFRINPINNKGLSHFHVAVTLGDVEMIEKFLKHGANINQPTDFWVGSYSGDTPLLMAIEHVKRLPNLEIVDLLLSRGADIHLENHDGQSVFHKAVTSSSSALRLRLMEKLLSYGANMNNEDVCGTTPFQLLLNSEDTSIEDIRFFLNRGCRANASNLLTDQGYLGVVFSLKNKKQRNLLFTTLMRAPGATLINDLGRTIIHNVVAIMKPAITIAEYINLFTIAKEFGHDVDDQDYSGRTALHLAVEFSNGTAVSALLNMGADLNVVDKKGKVALSYAVEPCVKCDNYTIHHHDDAIETLVVQIQKLNFFHLDVCRLNNDLIPECLKILKWNSINIMNGYFQYEIERARYSMIDPLPLTFQVFLSKKMLIAYCHISQWNRTIIDKAFESLHSSFKEICPTLKLQYRKAVMRFQLLQVVPFLKHLLGFSLPDLCSELVLKSLNNSDLKNVIAAINLVIQDNS